MNRTYDGNASQSSSPLPFGPVTWLIGAGALIAYGVTRRSKSGTAIAGVGGALAFAAAKRTAASSGKSTAAATFLLNASAEQAYQHWRNFQNLPRFMNHLASVRVMDDRRSEWTVNGPSGTQIRWNAEITDDTPNQRIAWRSIQGSDVETDGDVEFRPDPQGRGSYITAHVRYQAPGGVFGKAAASLLGKHPDFMVREDLRNFKALLETGEVPTTLGQTHGPRGLHGQVEQVLFRESTNLPEPQAAQEYWKTA